MKLKPGPKRTEELAKILHERSWEEQAKIRGATPAEKTIVAAEWDNREPIRRFWTGIAEEALKWII